MTTARVQVRDKVWIREEVVDPGAYEIRDGVARVWIEESCGKTAWLPAGDVLRDHPALPAVAALLHDEQQIVEQIADLRGSWITWVSDGTTDAKWDLTAHEFDERFPIVALLIAALRSGTEGATDG